MTIKFAQKFAQSLANFWTEMFQPDLAETKMDRIKDSLKLQGINKL